jgi:hypothetical protein
MKTCYYCGEKATSKEHVPPRCVFPKDKSHKNYRQNLITVYSCDKHNLEKSNDDEYLLVILLFNINANDIPYDYFNDKIDRLIKLKAKTLGKFFKNPQKVLVRDPRNGLIVPTSAFKIDVERYDRILKQISIGLYYYTYKQLFIGNIEVVLNGAWFGNRNDLNSEMLKLDKIFDMALDDEPFFGENSEVFKYKFIKDQNDIFLRIVFYERNKVLIRMNENPL